MRGKEEEEGRMVVYLFCFVFCFCLSFLVIVVCFVEAVDFVEEGAGFIRRGVVVGGGFRPLRALRTLRPAGCLEFG